MSRWKRAALIAAVSVAPHLHGISSPLLDYHYHRQANTASIARDYHEDGLPFLHPRVDWEGGGRERAATELPLYMWLLGLFWPLFGLGELWGRVLSVLFSALGALTLWRFLEGWIGEEASLWAALLFSLLPVEVYFGRTVQPEALALLCGLLSLLSLDRHLLSKRRDAALGWWLAAAVAAALAIGHKLPYAYLLGVHACLALARRGKAALRDLLLWAFPFAVALPVYAWYRYASSGVYVVPTSPGGFLLLLDYKHLAHYALFQIVSRFPELAATYPGLVLLAVGALELRKGRGPAPLFLAGWWLCVLAHLLLGGAYTFYHEYTILPFAPANAALMGVGLEALRRRALAWKGPARKRALAGVLLLALGVPLHAALRVKHWYRLSHSFLLGLAPAVARLSGPGDLFLCNERASSLYLFYIRRRGWSWDLEEAGTARLGEVDAVIRRGARFFLTRKSRAFLDPGSPIARHFYARFPVVYDDGKALIFRLEPEAPAR